MIVPRPLANSSFFALHSSFTKAKIGAFTRSAKNGVSVSCENLLTKPMFCVNKNNALIYRIEGSVFAREKHCFSVAGGKGTSKGSICLTSEMKFHLLFTVEC